ncbi:MAG: flagellar biosynthesis protein FlhB [Methylococcales bacterium]
MAEDSEQERSEEPSAKRLSDAREKGQIARSRELNTFVVLVVGSALLMLSGDRVSSGLADLMRAEFQISRADIFDDQALLIHFVHVMLHALAILAPFLGVMVIAAVAGPLGLGGWAFNLESLQPKWEKMDPLKGLARIVGLHGLIELVKSLVKFGLIFGVTVGLFFLYLNDFVGLANESIATAIPHGIWLIGMSFVLLSASVGLIAAIDVPFQLWDHKRKLKMTMQEVREEMKETDGRPEVKRRIRSLQMQMAQGRMMEEVPKADVILTNPTHFAVALKYEQWGAGAPRVVAKGKDLVAAHIRNLASGARVPIVRAPSLARALHHSTEVGHEIPEGLFLAVARVLAYVYQLKSAESGIGRPPVLPSDFPVPDEYRDGS